MRRCAAFTLVLSLSAAAGSCGRRASYPLEGQILAVDLPRQQITVKHGDIKGFMPGMTMPFTVREPALMAGRTPGDLIRATLVIDGSLGYLSDVVVTGRAPVTEPLARPAMVVLEPGELVPDAAFVDQAGAPRRFADWRGRVAVVTFVYSRCPLPDFCPLMDRHFAAVQKTVAEDPTLGSARVGLLSVSIDPIYDTPAVLREHARRAGARAEAWSYVTGDRDTIERFAARFGVAAIREDPTGTEVIHNLRTAVVDTQGRLAHVFGGNDWTVDALVAEIRRAARAR